MTHLSFDETGFPLRIFRSEVLVWVGTFRPVDTGIDFRPRRVFVTVSLRSVMVWGRLTPTHRPHPPTHLMELTLSSEIQFVCVGCHFLFFILTDSCWKLVNHRILYTSHWGSPVLILEDGVPPSIFVNLSESRPWSFRYVTSFPPTAPCKASWPTRFNCSKLDHSLFVLLEFPAPPL